MNPANIFVSTVCDTFHLALFWLHYVFTTHLKNDPVIYCPGTPLKDFGSLSSLRLFGINWNPRESVLNIQFQLSLRLQESFLGPLTAHTIYEHLYFVVYMRYYLVKNIRNNG